MLGDLLDVAFFFVPDQSNITGLNWRLMLGSAGFPALFVCCLVLFAPESPRWLIGRGRYQDAYNELSRLRFSPVQAARDLYYIHVLLEAEKEIVSGRNRLVEMWSVARNRNAAIASFIVMFGGLLPSWLIFLGDGVLIQCVERTTILRRQRHCILFLDGVLRVGILARCIAPIVLWLWAH
jgi:hypothetical protein